MLRCVLTYIHCRAQGGPQRSLPLRQHKEIQEKLREELTFHAGWSRDDRRGEYSDIGILKRAAGNGAGTGNLTNNSGGGDEFRINNAFGYAQAAIYLNDGVSIETEAFFGLEESHCSSQSERLTPPNPGVDSSGKL